MSRKQKFILGVLFLSLPVFVAWFDMPVFAAVLLVILALAIRQIWLLTTLTRSPDEPDLVLETILPSHFSEKARWCLDRLGVDYTEQRFGGLVGVFFTGRSVPMLTAQTGRSRSSICESSHILRYLYGRFAAQLGEKADFLKPTPERLEWEARLDRYGVSQQVWAYHFMLKEPALCKEAWGAKSQRIPAWHRWTILVMYPLFEMLINRGFQPDLPHYKKAVEHTESLLEDAEKLLADGRQSLLGGDSIDFVDITLASLSSVWLQPDEFEAGKYKAERIEIERFPDGMKADINRWRETFPLTTAYMERLYATERIAQA